MARRTAKKAQDAFNEARNGMSSSHRAIVTQLLQRRNAPPARLDCEAALWFAVGGHNQVLESSRRRTRRLKHFRWSLRFRKLFPFFRWLDAHRYRSAIGGW